LEKLSYGIKSVKLFDFLLFFDFSKKDLQDFELEDKENL